MIFIGIVRGAIGWYSCLSQLETVSPERSSKVLHKGMLRHLIQIVSVHQYGRRTFTSLRCFNKH